VATTLTFGVMTINATHIIYTFTQSGTIGWS
jgi:hypothetical protein